MDKASSIKTYWPIFILFLFGILFVGYTLEDSHYIAFTLNNANPHLYPTDLYINQQPYFSLFIPITGYLSRYINVKFLFTILYLITTFATALAIFHLSLLLFKDKLTSYLAVFLLLISKCGISLTLLGINPGVFEPSLLARPFSLFAIYLFLKKRYRIACLMTGLIFYIQGMEAFSISAMFLLYFLIRIKDLPKLQISQSLFLLFLIVLPAGWKLSSSGFCEIPSQEVLHQWLAILRFRSFWHLFPFSWGPGDYFNYLGWFLWAFVVLKYLHPPKRHDSIIVFCGAIALLCLIGTVFVEIIPIPIVIKMMPWRSTIFFVLLLIIYISHYLVKFPKENLISRLLVAGTVAAIFLSLQRLIVCFALLHLAFEARNKKYLPHLLAIGGIGGIFGFTVGSILYLEGNTLLLNKFFSFINLGLKNIIFFYLLFWFLIYFLYLQKSGRMSFSKRQMSSLMSFLIFLILIKAFLPKDIQKQDFKKDWIKTQFWAKENTRREDVFITPPYLEEFRIHSQRGIVADIEDGGVSVFDIKFGIEWWKRMNDLGYKNLASTVLDFAPECKRNYDNLDEKELARLGNKYGATYVVTEGPRELNFKLVYQNDNFKIYLIDSTTN